MEFQYSVIGDNSQENREWLEQVGFYQLGADWHVLDSDRLLCTNHYCNYFDTLVEDWEERKEFVLNRYVDCRGNDKLFRAVSAMRKDSDFKQWFTDGKQWILADEPVSMNIGDLYIDDLSRLRKVVTDDVEYWARRKDYKKGIIVKKKGAVSLAFVRKATLSELQEYFKA